MAKFELYIKYMRVTFLILSCFLVFSSCKKEKKEIKSSPIDSKGVAQNISYAKGFTITNFKGYKEIKVTSAWPDSKKTFRYLLVEKGKSIPKHDKSTVVITIPIERLVAMSTTNIPALEYLEVENRLVGFPHTDYISSEKTRKNIDNGSIKDLGNYTELNMELLLELHPELVIGFSVNGNNKIYNQIEKFGIPVVLDGAWTEQHPLGRAEWVKFIAAFFNKSNEADSLFKTIENNYKTAKKTALNSKTKPTSFSGSMFKDVWNVPGGKSFVAKYLEDANTDYIWKDNDKTGSLQLNFESVLEKAKTADLWIGAGYFETKAQMEAKNKQNAIFDAYKNNNIYTFTKKKGKKGGLLYFELGPLRPDLILQDLIKIAHPELLTDYEPFFFKRVE